MSFRILTRMLKQSAIYWAPLGPDEFGEEKLDLPITIKCRWEDELEEGIDATGIETTFKSTVYTDRDVQEGGILMFGNVDDDLDRAFPPPEKLSHRIRLFTKLPTLKAKQWLRTVKL